MKFNRETFFTYARNAPFGGRLTTQQVNGLTAILDEWEAGGYTDVRHLAYMMATGFWETGMTMAPVRETLATSDKQAVARLDKAWADGKLPQVSKPYWRFDSKGRAWFGRGLVQLTHEVNYAAMDAKLGIPLLQNPSLALDLKTSVKIMFYGMMAGSFTKKKLSDYFNATTDNPEGARAIINGKDKAKLIAGYHKNFLDALKAAVAGKAPEVTVTSSKPDDVAPEKSKSVMLTAGSFLVGGGATAIKEVSESGSNLLSSVTNIWSLLALLSVIAGAVGIGILGWLAYTGRLKILRKAE